MHDLCYYSFVGNVYVKPIIIFLHILILNQKKIDNARALCTRSQAHSIWEREEQTMSLKWVQASNGELPPGAIAGGTTGNGAYIKVFPMKDVSLVGQVTQLQ